jgi:hypothetical protein
MTRRALRRTGNESPAARARRLAGVAWAGYARSPKGETYCGLPALSVGAKGLHELFQDGFLAGYAAATEDMIDVDDERGG